MKNAILTRRILALTAALTGVIMTGCTSYLTARNPVLTHGPGKDAPNTPSEGFPYWLPRTQFEITAEWKVIGCKAETGDLIIKFTPAVEQKTIKGEMFTIDTRDVQGLMRNGKISTEYTSDGYTKTLNGESSDETAAVAKSVIGTIAKVVVASTGIPKGAGLVGCGKVGQELADQKTDAQSLAAAQFKMATAQENIDLWKGIIERKGAHVKTSDIAKYEDYKRDLKAAIDEVAVIQKRLDAHAKFLTFSDTITWIPTTETELGTEFAIDAGTAKQWELTETVRKANAIKVGLDVGRPTNVAAAPINALPISFTPPVKGIPYRVPADVSFHFCVSQTANCGDQDPKDEDIVKAVIPGKSAFQLGYAFVLPVEFQTFTSRSFSLEFDDNHILKKVSWEQKKSVGEGVATVADAAADANASIAKAKADADAKAAIADTTAEKLKADYLTAQVTVAELTSKLAKAQPNEDRDAIQAQLDQTTLEANLIKAQLDKANAEAALAKLQATGG